jgi:nucleoside-diphosphate-sugar epimerase
MIYLIGCRGRLGKAIRAFYQDVDVVAVDRRVYQDWWQDGSADFASRYFANCTSPNSVVYVTAGLLDPRLPQVEHLKINYLLPKHIVEGATRSGLRVVTFGSVMEKLITNQNSYIHSKAMLGNYIANLSLTDHYQTHFRVHTLYGEGVPSPFMFLGQIYRALKDQSVFEMSPGNQLREYHHIHDEVSAIDALVKSGANGVVDLSHGEPVSLKEIAEDIFAAFNCENLLRVGALPEPEEENYETIFERLDVLREIKFRETRPGIVSYLKSCFESIKS